MKKSRQRKTWGLALALLVCMLLAACGSPAPAPAPQPAAPVAPEATPQEPAGKLIMGTNAEFPPFEFVTEQGKGVLGEYDGIDVMLAQALATELGMDLEIVNMEFDSIVAAVKSGRATIGVAGMSITEDRLQNVDFTTPYWSALQSIIVPAGSAIRNVDDLQGKNVGVVTGYTGDLTLSDIGGINLNQYRKGLDAVMDLNNNRLDAVVIDSPTGHQLIKIYSNLTAIDDDPVFEKEEYAICVAKGNEELVAKLNAAIQKLIENGEIERFAAEVDERL